MTYTIRNINEDGTFEVIENTYKTLRGAMKSKFLKEKYQILDESGQVVDENLTSDKVETVEIQEKKEKEEKKEEKIIKKIEKTIKSNQNDDSSNYEAKSVFEAQNGRTIKIARIEVNEMADRITVEIRDGNKDWIDTRTVRFKDFLALIKNMAKIK